jgi:hypothetical protein
MDPGLDCRFNGPIVADGRRSPDCPHRAREHPGLSPFYKCYIGLAQLDVSRTTLSQARLAGRAYPNGT